MVTAADASGCGTRRSTTVTPTVPAVLLEVGEGDPLPDADALGVGSTVGPGGDVTGDGGRPTDGVVPTSTIRGVGAACTPTAPALGDEAEGLGEGAATEGPTVTVTTGPGDWAPTAGAPSWTSTSAAIGSESPPTVTAHRYAVPACRFTAR